MLTNGLFRAVSNLSKLDVSVSVCDTLFEEWLIGRINQVRIQSTAAHQKSTKVKLKVDGYN